MLILYGIMSGAAVLLNAAFGGQMLDLFAPGPERPGTPAVDVALGVGFGLLMVGFARFSSSRFAWAQRLDAEFQELTRPLQPRHVPALAVASALAEELFFRGFLQPRLGYVVTSLLFGAAHLTRDRRLLPWPMAATVMGFALGAMFVVRGSLLAPVLAHFTNNFFNLHHLLRTRTEEPT